MTDNLRAASQDDIRKPRLAKTIASRHDYFQHVGKGPKSIDELLINNHFMRNIEFTYIGNLPKNFSFKKTRHIKPLASVAMKFIC